MTSNSEKGLEFLEKNAYKLLLSNVKTGVENGRRYFYICPSPERYPHQFLWDSCFHSIVMRHFNITFAKQEIITLLSMVQSNGFLPHMTFWENPTILDRLFYPSSRFSRITQPPVIPIAVEKVYEKFPDKKFLLETLPPLKKYYSWLQNERDIDNDGMICSIHAWECVDGDPNFDNLYTSQKLTRIDVALFLLKTILNCKKLKFNARLIYTHDHFMIKSVLVNSIYIQGLRSLARLFKIVEDKKDSIRFERRANKVEKTLLSKCYDKKNKAFYDVYSKKDKKLNVLTISSLTPIILDNIPKRMLNSLIEKHLLNPEEFWLHYPIPSVAKNEHYFDVRNTWPLWRGPTWINTNWLIVKGLQKHGYHEIASEIIQKTKEMILKSGFWEFYNPFTGKGMRTKNYGWSTLVVDMLKDYANSTFI